MTKIRKEFEKFWKFYALKQYIEIKEKEKEFYYRVFSDGYGCAIVDAIDKKEKGK